MILQYEASKNSKGQQRALDEDTKANALECMCPEEIERHLQLNGLKFNTFDKQLEEVYRVIDTTSRGAKVTKPSQGYGGPTPMEVDAFGRKTPRAKVKGKTKMAIALIAAEEDTHTKTAGTRMFPRRMFPPRSPKTNERQPKPRRGRKVDSLRRPLDRPNLKVSAKAKAKAKAKSKSLK